MKKEYITPRCNVEMLHGQYLMLGVSMDSESTDAGNSDKSKVYSMNRNFWTGETTGEDTSLGNTSHWR
jgi:hypothetical protein